jgi:Zn-finger nucleic acid-binding protein
MDCPKCRHAFSRETLHGIPVQVCPSCRGIWFDREEIHAYLGQALQACGLAPALAMLREIKPVPTELICPACNEPWLKSIQPCDVEIEQCSGCRGVFLDPGELDLITLQSISDPIDRRATVPTPLKPVPGSGWSNLVDAAADGAFEVLDLVLCLLK